LYFVPTVTRKLSVSFVRFHCAATHLARPCKQNVCMHAASYGGGSPPSPGQEGLTLGAIDAFGW
jgi:hypothetical protein